MKNRNKISYFCHALMTLAFVGVVSACVNDDFVDKVVDKTSVDRLALSPTIADAKVITRSTASDSNLNEDVLVTLDVFVEEVGNTTTFFKKYHKTIEDATSVNNEVRYLLENKWREQGYKVGQNYNVYVAVNNPKTAEATETEIIPNSAALKALTYDEVQEGVAVVNHEGNIIRVKIGEATGDDGKPYNIYKYTGNIYKLYNSSAPADETSRDQTPNKQFMMDGFVENWSPTGGELTQTIPVNLSRAAAKIVLNVEFDSNFLTKLQSEEVSITGTPAWQFQNFAFSAPVFDPKRFGTTGEGETEEETQIIPRSADNMIYGGTQFGEDKSFSIVTYSYPISWTDYAGAPSLIVSIPYTSSDGTSYNYYRIPIVKNDEDITSIDRNTIYVINATIATRGSDTHEDITPIGDVNYYVLPWNDESNSDVIKNVVEAVQHQYLKVNPKVYTLRGDGMQSVDITYLKASGTSVGWKLFTYDANGNQSGVVANNADGAIRAWFYNSSAGFTTTYSDTGSGITWGNTMGVTITQSTEGVSGTSGKFTVDSYALTNKAIKYIRFRVFLNEEETLFEDVIIRHFPTDNIQNVAGTWSSYVGATSKITLTTTNEAQAQAWATEYGVEYKTSTVTDTEYINYATYTANASDTEHYHISGPTETDYDTFHNMVQNANNRRNANSQQNAVADSGEGHSYYWGTNPQQVTYSMWGFDYDYSTGNGWNQTYYKYTNYYTATYTHTSDPYTQYSVTYTTQAENNWVDWNRDNGQTYNQSGAKYTRGSNFIAKVYNGTNRIYPIEVNRTGNSTSSYRYTYRMASGYNANTYTGYQEGTNTYGYVNSNMDLTNNHMYVVQISSTSDTYVLGRPYVNEETHLSQDDVVSPAFMIASQLGAVTPFSNAGDGATHCNRYLEVASDGTRYSGWRLPTPAEIGVITRYQNGSMGGGVTIPATYRVLTVVLGGDYYWSLAGTRVRTVTSSTDQDTYLRCVRDLSAEEVERLNSFDTIINKYQNK